MRVFQVAVLMFFGFALLIGALIFSGILPGFRAPTAGTGGKVVLWGTIPNSQLEPFLRDFRARHQGEFTLEYVAKNKETFEDDYLQALALGRGPDLVFFPQEMINRFGDTLSPIPFETMSERVFRDTFIQGSEIYLSTNGILALPLIVDPLVMYYNRNILTNVGITQAPSNWSQLILDVEKITEIDTRRNVLTSAVALGEFSNINNAKDILAMLFLQAGNRIVKVGPRGYQSALSDKDNQVGLSSAVSALDFFIQFADQSRTTYTWSRSLPEAEQSFLAEKLAFYFGFASEFFALRTKNPNLNFDLSVVPQRDNGETRQTFGRFTGIAVLADSPNKLTAWKIALLLAAPENATLISAVWQLPPVRHDLLASQTTDAVLPVFYDSAKISRTWRDPAPSQTKDILDRMTTDALLKRKSSTEAVNDASSQIDTLFNSL